MPPQSSQYQTDLIITRLRNHEAWGKGLKAKKKKTSFQVPGWADVTCASSSDASPTTAGGATSAGWAGAPFTWLTERQVLKLPSAAPNGRTIVACSWIKTYLSSTSRGKEGVLKHCLKRYILKQISCVIKCCRRWFGLLSDLLLVQPVQMHPPHGLIRLSGDLPKDRETSSDTQATDK